MTVLRRLILTIKPEGHELRVLYRRKDGPNPGTARRRKEVQDLAAEALERALEALKEGPVESVGESGFSVREDVLSLDTPWKDGYPIDGDELAHARGRRTDARGFSLPAASSNSERLMKGA